LALQVCPTATLCDVNYVITGEIKSTGKSLYISAEGRMDMFYFIWKLQYIVVIKQLLDFWK